MSAPAKLTDVQKHSLKLSHGLVEVVFDEVGKPLSANWETLPDGLEYFAAAMSPEEICAWTESGLVVGTWVGSCRVVWELPAGGPSGHAMNFCPSCGRPLVESSGPPAVPGL